MSRDKPRCITSTLPNPFSPPTANATSLAFRTPLKRNARTTRTEKKCYGRLRHNFPSFAINGVEDTAHLKRRRASERYCDQSAASVAINAYRGKATCRLTLTGTYTSRSRSPKFLSNSQSANRIRPPARRHKRQGQPPDSALFRRPRKTPRPLNLTHSSRGQLFHLSRHI